MVRWLTCLLSVGILIGQDDGLPPNFVYLEPLEDFYARSPIELEIIVTEDFNSTLSCIIWVNLAIPFLLARLANFPWDARF